MPRSAQDFDLRGGRSKEANLPDQNAQRLEQTAHALITKTGFIHDPGATISFVDGTRTFTITPDNSTFDYWIQGVKYTKTAAESVIIDDTEGMWYIYYVGITLTASQVEWVIKDGDKCFVGLIHWDAANNKHIYLGYELHGYDMPPATHSYLHRTIGTNFVSGLALVEGTGGDDGKVAMDSGKVRDEDIHIDITDGAGSGLFEQELGNTTVFAAAQIPVYYRSGATAWRKYTAGDYPFYDNSGGDNIHYNLYSAPNWSSQEAATTAKYIAMWIFGTNNIHEPVIAIMGQSESSTLNVAKEVNTLVSISWGTLPFEEMKILYRLIFKSDSSHAHTEDLREVSNVPGGTYVPSPTPSLASVVAVGSELTSGQVITSADEDLIFIFGRAQIWSPWADFASFAHRDNANITDYAMHHSAIGDLYLNAKNGRTIWNRINNVSKMTLTGTELTMGVPIAMGTNKITGLGNGAGAQDAMAFGQKYTNANAVAAVNAAGLSLASTKVITSADEDLTFTFGRGAIGSPISDFFVMAHRDHLSITNYAFMQGGTGAFNGRTYINAPTGQIINFRINNIDKMVMDTAALTMSVPIAMGANNITGLANITQIGNTTQTGNINLTGILDVKGTTSTIWMTDTNTTNASLKIYALDGVYNFITANAGHAENVTVISFDYAGNITLGGSLAMAGFDITNCDSLRHGIASDDAVYTNAAVKSTTSATYVKVKEIIVYRTLDLRLFWTMGTNGGTGYAKVYINGVATGAEHTSGVGPEGESEDVSVESGDLLQIYAHHNGTNQVSVSGMVIKFAEYVSNDP